MRAIVSSLAALGLVLVCVSSSWAQTTITLDADADATVREADLTPQNGVLEVRSHPVRQRFPYIRFDLRTLATAPATGAVFSVTTSTNYSGALHGADEFRVYGVPDLLHNTPQQWVETELIYTTTGLEIPHDFDSSTPDIDTNRLVSIDFLPPASGAGETVSISNNAALDGFIADRYADDQQFATFIIISEPLISVYSFFDNRETGYTNGIPPTLELVSTLQALPPDTAPPTVAGHSPLENETDVELDINVTVTFSEPMDAATVTNGAAIALEDESSSPVAATVTYDAGALTATLVPDDLLASDTTYTATVLGGAGGVADAASNEMAASYSWSFTTELDLIPPDVVSVSPSNGQVDVVFFSKVQAAFNEEMDAASINTGTFLLEDSMGNPVDASVGYDEATLTAILGVPSGLMFGETYTATLVGGPGGITDKVGNPLAADYVWNFTTEEGTLGGPITLISVADTYTRSNVNAGTAASLDARHFGAAGDDFVTYVRFDLSGLGIVDISDATLSLSRGVGSRNDTIVTVRHVTYGLTDAPGNTPQDWEESTDLDAGAEYDNTGGNLIDTNLVFNLDQEQGANVTETVGNDIGAILTGPDLVAFLKERVAAGGLVTFIVACDSGGDDRGYAFGARENPTAAPPLLELTATRRPSITDVALASGPEMVVTWDALPTHTYAVERTADDLSVSNWVEVAAALPGATVNTYTDTVPVEAQVSYRVIDEGPSEYFFDDFEGPDMGWTTVTGATHNPATDWELGSPSVVGPAAPYSGTNCYATILNDWYGSNADIGLVSPQIDLAGAAGATLSFAHYYDTEVDTDLCEVYVRDASGGEITGLEAPLAPSPYSDLLNFDLAWEMEMIDLPAAVLGQTIRLEFRFTSDGGFEYDGWYLDDVKVGG